MTRHTVCVNAERDTHVTDFKAVSLLPGKGIH